MTTNTSSSFYARVSDSLKTEMEKNSFLSFIWTIRENLRWNAAMTTGLGIWGLLVAAQRGLTNPVCTKDDQSAMYLFIAALLLAVTAPLAEWITDCVSVPEADEDVAYVPCCCTSPFFMQFKLCCSVGGAFFVRFISNLCFFVAVVLVVGANWVSNATCPINPPVSPTPSHAVSPESVPSETAPLSLARPNAMFLTSQNVFLIAAAITMALRLGFVMYRRYSAMTEETSDKCYCDWPSTQVQIVRKNERDARAADQTAQKAAAEVAALSTAQRAFNTASRATAADAAAAVQFALISLNAARQVRQPNFQFQNFDPNATAAHQVVTVALEIVERAYSAVRTANIALQAANANMQANVPTPDLGLEAAAVAVGAATAHVEIARTSQVDPAIYGSLDVRLFCTKVQAAHAAIIIAERAVFEASQAFCPTPVDRISYAATQMAAVTRSEAASRHFNVNALNVDVSQQQLKKAQASANAAVQLAQAASQATRFA